MIIELEILFTSGQGIVVPMEDRESALRFMQQAMDLDLDQAPRLYHLSTAYEELLIDLGDISFIRLKKDNAPRIGATLKLPAHATAQPGAAPATAATSTQGPAEATSQPRKPEQTFTVDPSGNVSTDPIVQRMEKAEARLRQAESRLEEVDVQRRKVEADLRKTAEDIEDAVRESELRKNMEALEIDKEIARMKAQQDQ